MTLTPAARSSARTAGRWICSSCWLRRLKQSSNSFSTAIRQSNQQHFIPPRYNRQLSNPGKADRVKNFSTTAPIKSTRTREPKLPSSPARTRFAPSPTGYLHIGGLRTALFSYLLAKRTGGQFLLRIEDTDQKRLVPDAEAKLLSDLAWAGLQWDEGPGVGGPHGPYCQSERTYIYQEHAKQLLENESAYRCFCSPQSAAGAQIAYVTSGCYQNCSDVSQEESSRRAQGGAQPFTVRLRVPADAHKRVYPDLVYGKIQRLKRSPAAPQSEDGDAGIGGADTILLKSDGTPTYHFANVVDDHLMKITHVIRGVEWSASTPLHYDIYSAFNWTPPQFAHVGLLVDQNQAKLSKRNQDLALDVASMRNTHGVLPETLVNFLALLGWSNPTKNDVMDMQSLIDNFDLKFTRGNAMVRMEKLWFLQRKHVAEKCALVVKDDSLNPIEEVISQIRFNIGITDPGFAFPLGVVDEAAFGKLTTFCIAILLADSQNYENATRWVRRNSFYLSSIFDPALIPPEKGSYREDFNIGPEELRPCAQRLLDKLEAGTFDIALPDTKSPLALQESTARAAQVMRDLRAGAVGEREELMKPLMTYLREKITMGMPGPSIDTVMGLLGPKECVRRLQIALAQGQDSGNECVD